MAWLVSMAVLLSPNLHSYIDCANNYFVKIFQSIYGRQYVSCNVHSVFHKVEIMLIIVVVDSCSRSCRVVVVVDDS